MRMFKNTVITLGLLGVFNFYALGGEIQPGSVPGSLNYQGRLEKDNAPITGPVFLTFRIYTALTGGDSATCGNTGAVCRWASPETAVNAAQGIFSASITPPLDIFSAGAALYLEVQVESDVLTPREPLNSVAYAMVAKKLEDGASVSIATLTTTGNVGLGSNATLDRLSVSGNIRLVGASDRLCFSNNTCMSTAGVGTVVGDVTSAVDSILESGTGNTGKMSFKTSNWERMRITDASGGGNIGIGTAAVTGPMGTLDVDGSIYVGNEGVYDRDGGSVTVRGALQVTDGLLSSSNGEYISLGRPGEDDVIALISGGSERMRVHPNGYVGIGLAAPTANLHAAGDIRSNAGVRGGTVSMGAYAGDWTSLANEIRGQTDLLLQYSSPYNVGIGTNTPGEKLHVSGNIKSDYGVIAATAAFSDSVSVDKDGNFTANSGHGNMVYLSSTVIYGTLQVTGGVGSDKGLPAYLTDNNIFSGKNAFTSQITVSSDIVTINRIGVGVMDLDFPASKYLQIGDDKPEFTNDDAAAYLVSGGGANSKVHFYRGAAEAARIQTDGGNNLAMVINSSTKSVVDSTYYRIYNSVVLISTGDSPINTTTPAVYISSSLGNIGMGTTVLDPNYRLTVAGNIRISGPTSNGLIFADGTTLWSANLGGSVGSVSSNDDAVVRSDANFDGTGKVILRAGLVDGLVLNSGGNIGIGTLSPLGRLDVAGDFNISAAGVLRTAGTERMSAGGVLTNTTWNGNTVTVPYGGTGVATLASNGILYGNATGAVNVTVAGNQYQVLRAGTGGTPAFGAINLDQSAAVTGSLPVVNGGTGLTAGTSGGVPYFSGASAINTSAALAQYNVLIGGGAGAAPYSLGSLGSAGQVLVSAGGTANPAWQTIPTQSSTLLNATHTDTLADTVVRGDIIVGNATPKWARLAKGSQYQTLQGGLTDLGWGAVALDQGTAVTGILPAANGGTGNGFVAFTGPITPQSFALPTTGAAILTALTPVTVAQGGTNSGTGLSGHTIMISNGTSIVQGAAGTTTTLLHGNASGDPTYSAVSLATGGDVTGILPAANGGTGNGFVTFTGPITPQSFALPTTGAAILTALTPVTVAQGGTGLSAGTAAGGLPYYTGTTGMSSTPAGTAGQALISGGAGTPTWSAGTGASVSYQVARTTDAAAVNPCNVWTFTYGILTNVSADQACSGS